MVIEATEMVFVLLISLDMADASVLLPRWGRLCTGRQIPCRRKNGVCVFSYTRRRRTTTMANACGDPFRGMLSMLTLPTALHQWHAFSVCSKHFSFQILDHTIKQIHGIVQNHIDECQKSSFIPCFIFS